MNTATHVRITSEALRDRFQPGSLPLIFRANLAQDRLTQLVGHPEIHFDDSAFAVSELYVEQQRKLAVQALSRGIAGPPYMPSDVCCMAGKTSTPTPPGPRCGLNSRAG